MSDQKVRLLVSTVGFKAGKTISVNEETAAALVAARQAVRVGKPVEDEPGAPAKKK